MTSALKWVFNRTLNSVWFGILMMLLVAIYVAVGSGFPRVREFFEMDELAFFQAWPLKVLMGLLVAALVTVTFLRIPFTVPRYGVWMIHTGIVTLIYGMSYYYSFKQEGLTFIPKQGTVTSYYDRWERSLYVRVDGMNTGDEHVLSSLPRFKSYDERVEPVGGLKRHIAGLGGSDLRNLEPVIVVGGNAGAPGAEAGEHRVIPLNRVLGIEGALRFDVVGYWPYAELVTSYLPASTPADGAMMAGAGGKGGGDAKAATPGGSTGVRLEAFEPGGTLLRRVWLVEDGQNSAEVHEGHTHGDGGPAHAAREVLGELEVEHRHVTDDATARQVAALVSRIHALDVSVNGGGSGGGDSKRMTVDIGGRYEVGGYTIEVEDFNPAWTTMPDAQGNRETVKLLTLMVTPPAASGVEKFRRQVIPGRERVTDWKLNQPGAGPMGVRQSEPLDKALFTRYTFNDPMALLPVTGREKRIFITAGGGEASAGARGGTYLLATSTSRAGRVAELDGGKGEMMFGEGAEAVRMQVERVDNVRKVESVVETPREKRNRNAGEVGLFQMLAVRVSLSPKPGEPASWSKIVMVPFQQWALTAPWNPRNGFVQIPGTDRTVQLTLGNRTRPIAPDRKTGQPASVRLDKFDLVSYAGGSATSGMQRDFKSTLTIREGNGKERVDQAHMNNPVYFGGTPGLGLGDTYWTLFQAQWDPEAQRFTVLGVGNRPGVWIMTAGSVLMSVGLMYAFYAKPLIIRRRKERAIAEARAKGKPVPSDVPAAAPVAATARTARPVVVESVEGRISV